MEWLFGMRLLEVGAHADNRGLFCEVVSPRMIGELPELAGIVQVNAVLNPQAKTLRGLHWQDDPYAQGKWIRVLTGEVLDLVFDLRRDSPTYGRGVRVKLDNPAQGLWIPRGCAHGYLTLTPNTTVLYGVDNEWQPRFERVLHASILLSDEEYKCAIMNDKDRYASVWTP